MKITAADIGRKVILRNGKVTTIESFDAEDKSWGVVLEGTKGSGFRHDGFFYGPYELDEEDIVAFVDESEASYMHETHKLANLPTKTLRDEFAIAALTGILSGELYNYVPLGSNSNLERARMAYEQADAMMVAREVK